VRDRQACVWEFRGRSCKVLLGRSALRDIMKMAVMALPHETGGTLAGRYSDDSRVAEVTRALAAPKGAPAGKTWFVRPSDDEDPALHQLFLRSKGQIRYIGEWHTHPGGILAPSRRDVATLQDLAISSEVASDTPILLLIGGDIACKPGLACFLFDGQNYSVGRPSVSPPGDVGGMASRLAKRVRHLLGLKLVL